MKEAIYFMMFSALTLIYGCVTSSYSIGRDFDYTSVSLIEKGKTTSNEVIKLFGQPFSKTVISANQEKWIYTFISGKAKVQHYVVTSNIESSGVQKTLDILIQDGVVINYTYNEKDNPSNITTK